MRSVKISEFKARCLRILDEVATSGETLLITRRGTPIARVLPVRAPPDGDWLGSLEGTAQAGDDLIEPAVDAGDWEALRP